MYFFNPPEKKQISEAFPTAFYSPILFQLITVVYNIGYI